MITVLVSACLLGHHCKYNGESNFSLPVIRFLSNALIIPVCPEILGGLPTPRVPAERKEDIVFSSEGVNLTEFFQKGALLALDICERKQCSAAVLKSRSPSCGIGQIYDGTFSKTLIKGDGVFASLLRDRIPLFTEENFLQLIETGLI